MKDLFGQRLRSARLLAAMSQDQLVLAIDNLVTKNAIAKYERGEMMPGSKVLIAMAKALGIKTEYFFRPYTVEIQNVQFRKQKTLTATVIKTIQQKVTENLERYCEVEQLLNISTKFRNEISHITISNGGDIEVAANHLRKKWNLGTNVLHNVVGLLEDKGIKVIEIDAPTDFDGLSGHVGADPVLVVSKNKDRFIDRKRMTVLHELGHILLSFAKNLKQAAKERFCFRFAAAMMMPRETMIEEIGEKRKHISLAELIPLKETYGMSIQGLIRRAKDLKILSEAKYKAWKAKINLNEKEEGWGQYNGYEKTTRFMQLIYRAVSEELITISKAADLANVKLAQFRDDFHVA